MLKRLLFYCCIISPFFATGQNYTISGRVIDKNTKEALPFVHVSFGNKGQGTTTNIDGQFEIKTNQQVSELVVSYLGYYTDTIKINKFNTGERIVIEMIPTSYNIEAAIILPGENPAHRIINKVLENRDKNNPEKMQSFTYRSYNKMHFTARKDTSQMPDSIPAKIYKIDRMLEKQHLMLLETVNEKKFIYPGKSNEQIIASKVSGFNDPILSLIASQIQSFSFYNDYFVIFDKMYVNPISKGSTNRYFFMLEDTLFSERSDTVFVISYRPKKDKIFDGLKGFLHITTNGYAIQSVIAKPLTSDFGMMVSIKHNYEFIDNQQWFPKELHTEIIFDNGLKSPDNIKYELLAIGRSYISDIHLNPELDKKDFSQVEVKIKPDANEKTELYWNENRVEQFYNRDSLTYAYVDSVSKAENLEKIFKVYEVLLTGYIPFGIINFPINQLADYNKYEGWRLGLGILTNRKLSRYFEVGGYAAYGFKDESWKYGGTVAFNLHENSESKLQFSYVNDVTEKAGYSFYERLDFATTELYRKFIIKHMDKIEKQEVSFSFRTFDYLNAKLFFKNEIVQSTDNYQYINNTNIPVSKFTFSEAGIQLRFAYKEKYLQTDKYYYSMGTSYPVILANIARGFHYYNGEYKYTRYEFKISDSFRTSIIGKTKLTLVGGLIDSKVPLSKLYNGHANYSSFDLDAENSFATMRMNEFYNERFLSVFFRQEIGSLFRINSYAPKFVLASNFGIGALDFNANHQADYEIKSMNKGFYESGVLINGILKQQRIIGYGIGVYYRYGAYSYVKTADNFAYKLTFTVDL